MSTEIQLYLAILSAVYLAVLTGIGFVILQAVHEIKDALIKLRNEDKR